MFSTKKFRTGALTEGISDRIRSIISSDLLMYYGAGVTPDPFFVTEIIMAEINNVLRDLNPDE